MAWALWAGMVGCAIVGAFTTVRADDFGRIAGPALFDIPGKSAGVGTGRLSIRTIEMLPEVVRGERAAFIVATTDQGNVAKLLVSPGLRRKAPTDDKPALVPVISLDRFETIDRGDRVGRTARGRGVVLFDGSAFDLDTGQVVPAGFGGDIAYSSQGPDGPALIALGATKLFAIDRPVPLPGPGPSRPSPGPAVLPTDFNGRFTLVSNGQMSGVLEIDVAADGAVSGRFRSDRNGRVYPVTGKVAADLSRRIELEIQFPRSKQVFDGLLWTEEKNVFAGTVTILEHPYSFVAVREGSPLVPEPIDGTSPVRAPAALKSATRVIALDGPDRYELDGVPKTADELTAALSAASKGQAAVEVLLRVPASTSFEAVQRAVRLVRGAGIATVRIAAADSR